MTYQIIHKKEELLVTCADPFTHDEFMAASIECWEFPNWQQLKYYIWDMRGIHNWLIKEREAIVMAKMDNVAEEILPRQKVALIASNLQIIKFCEKYIAAREGEAVETRVFDNEPEARKWVSS